MRLEANKNSMTIHFSDNEAEKVDKLLEALSDGLGGQVWVTEDGADNWRTLQSGDRVLVEEVKWYWKNVVKPFVATL